MKISTAMYASMIVMFTRRLLAKCGLFSNTSTKTIYVVLHTLDGTTHATALGVAMAGMNEYRQAMFKRACLHILRDEHYQDPDIVFGEAELLGKYSPTIKNLSVFPTHILLKLVDEMENNGGLYTGDRRGRK